MEEKIAQGISRLRHWLGTPASLLVHSILFIGIFVFWLPPFNVPFERLLLVLTTVVSLEAIYFEIFLQMNINQHGVELERMRSTMKEVKESVAEVQESVGEVQEVVEIVQETVEENS